MKNEKFRMKNWVIILVVLMAVACGGQPKAARTAGGEGAVFDLSAQILENRRDTSIFIGKVRVGEIIQYDAWLHNIGTEPLVITSVETSCGCTSVEYEKQPIRPDGKGHFSFRFDSRGQMSGRQVKYIDIHTSAGKNSYTIMMNAEVEE
jgi:hypothetical protein